MAAIRLPELATQKVSAAEPSIGVAAGGGGVVVPRIFLGTNGDDILRGSGGADTLRGFDGDDVYWVNDRGDRVSERRGEGDDLVRASIDYKLGRSVENLLLTGDRDTDARGNALDNALRGDDGRNRLAGGDGDDRLFGGEDDDVLTGGRGADRLTGGEDGDVFLFQSARDSGPGRTRDTIRDFGRGQDKLDFSRIDADVGRARDQDFDCIGRTRFGDEAGELRFRDGLLEAECDGDGRADFAVALKDVARLEASDLIL